MNRRKDITEEQERKIQIVKELLDNIDEVIGAEARFRYIGDTYMREELGNNISGRI